MAVAASPEPLLKSHPDVNKLNGFSSITVTVTRHKAARGTSGEMVVPSQTMKLQQLLELQTLLPVKHGPGFYKFTAADTGGGDADSWMVQLRDPNESEVSAMPSPPFTPVGSPAAPFTAAPLDPETKQIMPGWYYNETTGLLMTPWREAVQWRQGEPLPKPPVAAASAAPHLAAVPPNANPWNWPPQSSWGAGAGWGGYAVTSDSDELKSTKAQLEQLQRQRELDQIREDNRRREEEQRRRDEERDRTTREMFDKMAAAIAAATAKPSGPSAAELQLQREAEDTRRRLEESERRAAEERREQQRREEQRLADERHREEMRALKDEFRANKQDPMSPLIGMFSSMISNIQQSSNETIRSIKETVSAGTASAERFMMRPAEILDMVRQEKAGSGEMAATVLATTKEMMTLQKDVFTSLLDQAGSGGQPAWVGLASEAMQKIGTIGQALAERNQREAAQAQYVPPQPVRRAPPQQQRPVQVQQPHAGGQPQIPRVPRQQVPAAVAARPGYVDTGGRPEGTIFDDKTEEFVLADGMRIKQSAVEKDGWVVAIKEAIRVRGMQQGQVQPQGPEPAPAAMNGAAPATNGAAGAPAPAKKGRRKNTPAAAAPPPPPPEPEQEDEEEDEGDAPPPKMPPPANPAGYTLAEMKAADPDAVLETLSAFDDAVLFGDLWQYIPQLRQSRDPQEIVKYILQGQAFLRSSGKSAPAMDLLDAEQLEPFVRRLLPQASEDFLHAVYNTLVEAMGLTSDEQGVQ